MDNSLFYSITFYISFLPKKEEAMQNLKGSRYLYDLSTASQD